MSTMSVKQNQLSLNSKAGSQPRYVYNARNKFQSTQVPRAPQKLDIVMLE